MEFLYEYGMFLLKAVTIVVALLVAFGGIIGLSVKPKSEKGELEIVSISEKLEEQELKSKEFVYSKDEFKAWEKQKKKADKEKAEQEKQKKEKQKKEKQDQGGNQDTDPKLFVLDFDGSIDAKEVQGLREEITALLLVAKDNDEVLVRLESPGGAVHGYGLAASQLARIRDRGLKLTVSVDKIAASGGYMMACVADKIVSAPFAYIGSIGVIAQLPNFNKVLKNYDVEWEQHTAGDFKRTLTFFGENTDEAREKFQGELEEIHYYFKEHIAQYRDVDLNKVATGEHWVGTKALELDLVDEIQTSDDLLINEAKEKEIFLIKYKAKKSLASKFSEAASLTVENTLLRLLRLRESVFK